MQGAVNPLHLVWIRRCAVANRVHTYDCAGGIANDREARHLAAQELAQDLSIPVESAYELLADALARRAASNLAPTE